MTKLTRTEWLYAGYEALVEEGLASLKAEKLSNRLKVSKGSFYGYFDNIQVFHDEMLSLWREVATETVIKDFNASENYDVESFIKSITGQSEDFPFDTRKAELALREWGRFDPKVQIKIGEVDAKRLEFLEELFDEPWKARAIYQCWIGGEWLGDRDASKTLLNIWRKIK